MTSPTIDQIQDSLTVAASAAITNYADTLIRGWLVEHPAAVLHRLGLLEDMLLAVRTAAERELADGRWDGTTPADPLEDHLGHEAGRLVSRRTGLRREETQASRGPRGLPRRL